MKKGNKNIKRKNSFEKFLDKKVTRRQFIKYGLAGAAGLSASAYLLKKVINKPGSLVPKNNAPESLWKWSKEAYYYKKLDDNRVQCETCPNRCLLDIDGRSICRSKVNKDGKLYSIAYGNPCAVHIDPIEKKPLFHFLPSTLAFSIAAAGCTFRCLNCQNWDISQSRPEDVRNFDLMPQKVVDAASSNNCSSIAYTYSEPTSFYEYMYDTSKLAHQKSIKNVWITNGSINEKPLKALCKYIDAANVDVKNFKEEIYSELCSGKLKPVLDTLKTLKKEDVWFEITNLVIPNWSDDLDMIREMCNWLNKNGLSDYPIHFSRFHAAYKLAYLPSTPISIMEKAQKIALDEGIKYAYIGNVPGHNAENTFCHNCGKMIIKRKGYLIEENNIDQKSGTCKFCGEKIPGVWKT